MTEAGTVEVSAVVLRDAFGAVLTVRKAGTDRFMLPGGKPEPGETPLATAVRECSEEVGLDLDPGALRPLGTFRAAAANEPGFDVVANVFEHPDAVGTVTSSVTTGVEAGNAGRVIAASGEIAELRWLDPTATPLPDDLAPLLTDVVLPALATNEAGARGGNRPPRAVTVFTGSATGTRPAYAEAVVELAHALAGRGIGLVYGGGDVGLMGRVADAALEAGGSVTGVMPQSLVDGEITHSGLTSLEVVADMHERKLRMGELGEAFVALPGGVGTLEEFFEVWTWQNLGFHAKPVALYDVEGFWQPLIATLDRLVDDGFLEARYRDALIVASTPDELFDAWSRWAAPPPKWGSA
ncbi:MAG: TIGR00730 family Rossman fold protein [Pseudoclavibacter sp.]